MNVLVFFSSLAGYQSDNTMQPTTPQNDTALFSPRVFWNEMKISVFTLDGKQLFKQSGSKMFFFFFFKFQPRAALRMRLLWESAQPGENCKEFFFFFFYCQQAVNHFPLKHKSGAARANDLMYPDRISFSPPAFLPLPFQVAFNSSTGCSDGAALFPSVLHMRDFSSDPLACMHCFVVFSPRDTFLWEGVKQNVQA